MEVYFWKTAPVTRLLFPLIGGILTYYFSRFWQPYVIMLAVLFLGGAAAYFFWYKLPSYRFRYINGLIINPLFFLFGLYFTGLLDVHNHKCHFSLYAEATDVLKIRLTESPEERTNGTFRFRAEVFEVISDSGKIGVSGQLLCYFRPSEQGKLLKYGDIIWVKNKSSTIRDAGNPEAFDYAAYLHRKGITHQLFADSSDWMFSGKTKRSPMYSFSFKCREYITKAFSSSSLKTEHAAILKALILGNKSEIEPETLKMFAKSGAMHLLAVSGLHVGIMYVVVCFLIGYPKKYSKNRFAPALVVVGFLWFYALLTGLAGSVSRASLMFTVMVMGTAFSKKPSTFNTIAFSALVLLLINPWLLFDTGFQLSYSAVLGIVSIQPFFANLWKPNFFLLKWAYSVASVSIAAQLGTLPISIFYFQQFPNYFLITNLAVLPMAGVLVYSGLLIPLLFEINILFQAISYISGKLLGILEFVVLSTASLPGSSTQNLYLSKPEVLFLYIIIICMVIYLRKGLTKTLIAALIFSLIFVSLYNHRKAETEKLLAIVYNTGRHTLIEFFCNNTVTRIRSHELGDAGFHTQKLHSKMKINTIVEHSVDSIMNATANQSDIIYYNGIISHNGWRICLLGNDNRKLYTNSSTMKMGVNAVIVCDNFCRPNAKAFQRLHTPAVILASGVRSTKTINEWKQYCGDNNIMLWVCSEQGAFVYRE